MARYLLGAPATVTTTVRQRNTDGSYSLATPTTLVLTVQRPDLTLQAYAAPTADSLGTYHQDVPAADLGQVGHYQYKWVSTGPGAGVAAGSFDVADPFDVSLLSLQDAKDMLNISQATTTYDAEIQSWIDAIEAGLERLTGGPLVNRTVVERAEICEGGAAILVRKRPLVSVTSIADPTGAAVSTADVDLDPNSGVIRRRLAWPWWTAYRWVTVTYVAGWGVPTPPAFNRAAAIILDHLWQTQHGPSTRPSMAGDETGTDYGLGFAIPNRAAELLAPYAAETGAG